MSDLSSKIKWGPILISCLVVAGFVGILILLIFKPITLEDHVATILNVLTGTLAAKFGDVVQYHIGSSAGSKEKDDTTSALLLNQK